VKLSWFFIFLLVYFTFGSPGVLIVGGLVGIALAVFHGLNLL